MIKTENQSEMIRKEPCAHQKRACYHICAFVYSVMCEYLASVRESNLFIFIGEKILIWLISTDRYIDLIS